MRFRTALLTLGLALAATVAVHAQDSGNGPDRRTRMMFRDITLTEAQQAKVDSILAHYRAQMPASPGGRPDSATMATRRAAMQHQWADIRAVLTKEQQATFDRNLEEMRNRMGQRQNN